MKKKDMLIIVAMLILSVATGVIVAGCEKSTLIGTWPLIGADVAAVEADMDKIAQAELEEVVVVPEPAEPITFVLIDLSEQRLWILRSAEVTDDVEACEVLLETGIVTGTANTSRETPTGLYHIDEKVPGTYLYPSDGPPVWVDRWMPFNGGIGMHDATWRDLSQFGTNQYLSSGSHGCINMPHDVAMEAYNIVEVNTPVYVVD